MNLKWTVGLELNDANILRSLNRIDSRISKLGMDSRGFDYQLRRMNQRYDAEARRSEALYRQQLDQIRNLNRERSRGGAGGGGRGGSGGGSGSGGGRNTDISFESRLAENRRITQGIGAAERNIAAIRGLPGSAETISQLQAQIERLRAAQDRLSRTTSRTSDDYRNVRSNVMGARDQITDLARRTRELAAQERARNRERAAQERANRPRNLTFEGRLALNERIRAGSAQGAAAVSTLGRIGGADATRMAGQLQNEMQRLTAAQTRLRNITDRNSAAYREVVVSIANARRNISRLSQDTARMNRRFNASRFAADGMTSSLKNLARSYLSVFAVIGAASSAFNVAKDFDRIRATMLLSSGSAALAAENFDFVRKQANRLGLDITSTADAFAAFNVAATSSGMSTQESQKIFSQLATSVRATGLNAVQSGRAFLAFKQMMAGPVIQGQEMNQINEQMPQFTGIAIKALREMGYEGENYKKIIETGTVSSEIFLKTTARLLEEQAVSSGALEASQDSLTANQARMMNAFKEASDTIFRSGLGDALKTIFSGISSVVKGMTPLFSLIAKGVSLMVASVSAALSPIHELLQAIGFEGGLGSALMGIIAIISGGVLGYKIFQLIKWLRSLTLSFAILKGVTLGFAGIASMLAGATAAAYGVSALMGGLGMNEVPEPTRAGTNVTNIYNSNADIKVDGAKDPSLVAKAVMEQFDQSSLSNMPSY